jgi:signal peptidase I
MIEKGSNNFLKKRFGIHKGHPHEGWGSALSTIAILLAAPLVALFLTAFVFQSYQVDGSSMETTLQNNDRLIVWKLSRTWSRITHNSYVPNRGDVIIFTTPKLASVGEDPHKQLIKRVIGLPGERIVVHGGKITVYNTQHPSGFNPDRSLPYGKVIETTGGDMDIKVPKGSVFVCGDNRDNSLDSRVQSIGPVETKYIVGKLVLRVWPLGKAERF